MYVLYVHTSDIRHECSVGIFEFLIQAAYFAERFHIDLSMTLEPAVCKNRKFDHHNITCNAISRQKGGQLQLALRLLKRYPELV